MKRTLFFAAVLFSMSMCVAQNPGFEGEIQYENTITTSKGMRKVFPSLFKDGSYEVQMVIKGNLIKSSDTFVGTINYENHDKDMAYVYSPMLNKGFKYSISTFIAKQDEQYSGQQDNVAYTGEAKNIEGFNCKHYKGSIIDTINLLGAPVTSTTTLDYWLCEDFPEQYFGSIKIKGIPMMFEEQQVMSVPLLGSQHYYTTVNMTKVEKRAVADSELAPPAGVEFKMVDDPMGELQKLYKEIAKYAKKNNVEELMKINHGTADGDVKEDAWD